MKRSGAFGATGIVLVAAALCLVPLAEATSRTTRIAASVEDGDRQYNFVAGLFERGFHEQAVTKGEEFLRDFPEHSRAPRIRYRVGQSLFELGEYDKSAKMLLPLERLGDRFEFAAELSFRIAQCQLELGQLDPAAKRFAAIANNKPDYLTTAANYYCGQAYFQAGKYQEAAEAYGRVFNGEDNEDYQRGALYGFSWACYRSQELEAASQGLQLFLKHYPEDESAAEMRFLLGECQAGLGQHEEALSTYLSVPRGEFFDDALSAAGFSAVELNNSDRAAKLFLRLERDEAGSPLLAEARLHGGIHSFKAGRMNPAASVLDRLLESGEGARGDAFYWRGLVERERAGAKGSLDFFERGLTVEGSSQELQGRLRLAYADALFDAGEFDRAESMYQKAGARSADALYSAAVAALNAGNHQLAETNARRLLKEHPTSDHASLTQVVLGETQFLAENYDESLQAFQAVASASKKPEDKAAAHRPRALSRVAWCLFLTDRFADAAKQFKALVAEFPDDEHAEEAAFMAGRSEMRAGNLRGAEVSLAAYLQKFGDGKHRGNALYDLSQAKRDLGKPDEAGQLLDRLARMNGSDQGLSVRALHDRAELHAGVGEHDLAAPLFERVISAAPEKELLQPALYAHAWSCYELGQWDDARGSLQKLLVMPNLEPRVEAPALELLTSVERGAGKPNAAVKSYQELRSRHPKNTRAPEAAVVAALALKEGGKNVAAAALLEEAGQSWPAFEGRDRMTFELAFLYRELDRRDESVAAFTRLVIEFEDSELAAEASFHLGEDLFDRGRYEDALASFKPAVKDGCRVADLALYKSGWCHFRSERMVEAATQFAEVPQRFPDSVMAGESLFLAGESLYRAEQWRAAAKHLQVFLDRYPEHQSRPKGLFRLGVCQGENADFAACFKTLSGLERQFPEFEHLVEADLWLGRSLLGQDRPGEARGRFERVLNQDRGLLAARAHLGLGKCYLAADNYDEALLQYLQVAMLYEGEEEVAEGLWQAGLCLEHLEDPQRAAARYRELIEKYPSHPLAKRAKDQLDKLVD